MKYLSFFSANDGPGQETVGKPVKKKFGKQFYTGTVESFDPEEKWYKVSELSDLT